MTYRERREARVERLREWAEKREAKSEAAFGGAHALADSIPFGQPILVGHHSQRRAERDRDRIHNGMSAGVEHSRRAQAFRSRADNIERAADHAIYSDDTDAVDRLRERIASLEAKRDRIKAYNASCKKGARDLSILDEAQKVSLLQLVKIGFDRDGAFPSYALTNLGGNIRRNKERLAALEVS